MAEAEAEAEEEAGLATEHLVVEVDPLLVSLEQ